MPKDFIAIQKMHGEAFVFVKVPFRDFLHASSNKAVRHVCHRAGIRRNLHELTPLAAAVTRLLGKFTLCSLKRRFALLDHATWQLVGGYPGGVSVLTLYHELTVLGYGDHIDPIGIVKHVILRHDASVRQLQFVHPRRQPWLADEIFARQQFPFCANRIHISHFSSLQPLSLW